MRSKKLPELARLDILVGMPPDKRRAAMGLLKRLREISAAAATVFRRCDGRIVQDSGESGTHP